MAKSKPIVVAGGGRQARNVLEILGTESGARSVARILDDTKPSGELVAGFPVFGPFANMHEADFVGAHVWNVAVGDPAARH